MVILDKTIISGDLISEEFVCDLNKCKGACCVEGDLGAPLEENELDQVDEVLDVVKPYLSKEAVDVLNTEGGYLIDEEGDYSTTTINGAECAFAYYDEQKVLKCSIEQANKEGKTNFKKPISCHLYPIRIQKLAGDHEALNYDRWHICSDACDLGKSLKVPVYQFLREALIRKYGESWYNRLHKKITIKD
ncbi:MAG: DUF3109 family protein [Cyclobacteriaceae bacterium]